MSLIDERCVFLAHIAIEIAKGRFADAATVLEDMDLAAAVAVLTCKELEIGLSANGQGIAPFKESSSFLE
jgi:hypothetical protein